MLRLQGLITHDYGASLSHPQGRNKLLQLPNDGFGLVAAWTGVKLSNALGNCLTCGKSLTSDTEIVRLSKSMLRCFACQERVLAEQSNRPPKPPSKTIYPRGPGFEVYSTPPGYHTFLAHYETLEEAQAAHPGAQLFTPPLATSPQDEAVSTETPTHPLASFATGLGVALWVIGGIVFFFAGPYVVARVFPEQTYHITFLLGGIAFLIGLLALLLGIARSIRPLAGLVLVGCSYIIGLFLWVWSVLIVDQTWGLITLYVANFFLLVGAVVVAFFAQLFNGLWSSLWQFVVIAVIIFGLRAIGISYADSGSESEHA